eukprot:Skav215968  [mRNA]  locus=scaffold498:120188:120663:- [translate_table: standard]
MRKAHRVQRKEEKRLEEDDSAINRWLTSHGATAIAKRLGAGDLSATSRTIRWRVIASRVVTRWYLNLREVQMFFHELFNKNYAVDEATHLVPTGPTVEEERLKGKPNFAVPLVPEDDQDVQKVGLGHPVAVGTAHQ